MMRSKVFVLLLAVLPLAFAADEPAMVKLVSKDGKTIEVEAYPTSILPLHKGIFGGESWSDEVEELVFYDFAWEEEKGK